MRFGPSTEAQLSAAAGAADRANRPTILVVAPALLLLGAVIITLITFQRFSSAKATLKDRVAEQTKVNAQVDYYAVLEQARPDVATLYPINDFMDTNMDDIARDVWGEELPITVSPKSNPRPVGLNRAIERSDVEVGITAPTPIDEIFEFVHRVLSDEQLDGVFLAKIDIRPNPGGWTGQLKFRTYERAR